MEREQRRLRQEAWLFWLLKKSLGRLRMEPPGLDVGGYNCCLTGWDLLYLFSGS